MTRKFLLCRRCGNLMEIVKDSGVTPICCGTNMQELTANTTDAASEKHVPVIRVENNMATIMVGEVPHPMTEEHYIEWIYLKTNKRMMRVDLKPNDEPKAIFALANNEEVIEAYAYCNLHSLWMKENK